MSQSVTIGKFCTYAVTDQALSFNELGVLTIISFKSPLLMLGPILIVHVMKIEAIHCKTEVSYKLRCV